MPCLFKVALIAVGVAVGYYARDWKVRMDDMIDSIGDAGL